VSDEPRFKGAGWASTVRAVKKVLDTEQLVALDEGGGEMPRLLLRVHLTAQ